MPPPPTDPETWNHGIKMVSYDGEIQIISTWINIDRIFKDFHKLKKISDRYPLCFLDSNHGLWYPLDEKGAEKIRLFQRCLRLVETATSWEAGYYDDSFILISPDDRMTFDIRYGRRNLDTMLRKRYETDDDNGLRIKPEEKRSEYEYDLYVNDEPLLEIKDCIETHKIQVNHVKDLVGYGPRDIPDFRKTKLQPNCHEWGKPIFEFMKKYPQLFRPEDVWPYRFQILWMWLHYFDPISLEFMKMYDRFIHWGRFSGTYNRNLTLEHDRPVLEFLTGRANLKVMMENQKISKPDYFWLKEKDTASCIDPSKNIELMEEIFAYYNHNRGKKDIDEEDLPPGWE